MKLRRLLTILVPAVLAIGLMPMSAFASDNDANRLASPYSIEASYSDGLIAQVSDLEAASGQGGVTVIAVRGEAKQEEARKLLSLVNAARKAAGVSELKWDSSLEQTAIQRAAECAISYSHTRPDGSECFTAFPSVGHAGENIAQFQLSAESVNKGWTGSPEHYGNMVNPAFTRMGAAVVICDDMWCWVEVFGDGLGSGFPATVESGEITRQVRVLWPSFRLELMNSPAVAVGEKAIFKLFGTYDQSSGYKPRNTVSSMGFTWSSSDDSVFKVVGNAEIEGVGVGTADLIATSKGTPSQSRRFRITVVDHRAGFEYQGVSGGCYWGIDTSGKLLIDPIPGSDGELSSVHMPEVNFPWLEHSDMITRVEVLPGVSSGISMREMFRGCINLKTADIHALDTSKAADMDFVFNGCSSLETVDMTGLDTSSVESFWYTFSKCSNLVEIKGISDFNTSSLKHTVCMFEVCISLKELDLSKWDTSSLVSTMCMFMSCASLEKLNLSGWNTQSLID